MGRRVSFPPDSALAPEAHDPAPPSEVARLKRSEKPRLSRKGQTIHSVKGDVLNRRLGKHGEDLCQKLAKFIRQVAESVPAEQTVEPMLTLEEVSKRFNVSTKTISRWRVKGLAARRVKVNGRSQLGFPTAAVEKFVAEHKVLVEKGARFSHLTDAEKEDARG